MRFSRSDWVVVGVLTLLVIGVSIFIPFLSQERKSSPLREMQERILVEEVLGDPVVPETVYVVVPETVYVEGPFQFREVYLYLDREEGCDSAGTVPVFWYKGRIKVETTNRDWDWRRIRGRW